MIFQFKDIRQPLQHFDGFDLLSASWRAENSVSFVHTLVFGPGSAEYDLEPLNTDTQTKMRDLRFSDSRIMTVRSTDTETVRFQAGSQDLSAQSFAAEADFFAGKNVGMAVHNLESLDTILQWLAYHVAHHGMDAALIVCRQRDALGQKFGRKLERAAAKIDGLQRLMVWSVDVALGKMDEPSEAHPLTVRGAPGKDRLEPPAPDPQTSPFGQFQIYELLHNAYLTRARAVMNLDVHDLLAAHDGPSVFDAAASSDSGLIELLGEQCYPWRVKKGQDTSFGDHIYQRFDETDNLRRWCVCPTLDEPTPIWRVVRVVGLKPAETPRRFHRFMGLKHPIAKVARLVPKSSLIPAPELEQRARDVFGHSPVLMPDAKTAKMAKKDGTAIVTTMKNEGPFILEWVAYHRVIGVDRFLVYTNDCTDGTDTFLELLQSKGYLQHRDNKFEGTGLKPQHNAFRLAEDEDLIRDAAWVICMDVDEYITIKTGDGTLSALYDAIGDANMVALNWRLFGNNNVHAFEDRPIMEQFTRCAPEYTRKPHQAWGFKTLFKNNGIFKKLGVHRPKGLKPQLWDDIEWLNGSGQPIPKDMFRNAWRSTTETYGYDLVQLNHYAVRSAESFLVKRDRGRVNHVDRDQGLSYWFRMNNNAEPNYDIQPMVARLRAEMDRMLADPDIAAAHADCVARHRAKIEELKATPNYAAFYDTLTGQRQERLSQMHQYFGANVFLAGPDVIPDSVVFSDPTDDFFFTVDATETTH